MEVEDLHQEIRVDNGTDGRGSAERARGCAQLIASSIDRLLDGRRQPGVLVGDRQLAEEQRIASGEGMQLLSALGADNQPGRRQVQWPQHDPVIDAIRHPHVQMLGDNDQQRHAGGSRAREVDPRTR